MLNRSLYFANLQIMITKCFKKVVNSTISSLFAGIVVIMAMFMVVGCEKDESGIDKFLENQDSKAVLYNLKVNEEGIIEFKDFEERKVVLDELMKMNDSEIQAWERIIGFKSYQTYLSGIQKEISEAQSEQEYYDALELYRDCVYLETLEDGSRSVEQILLPTLYLKYCNNEGVFIVGDSIFKIGCSSIVCTPVNNKNVIENLSVSEIDKVKSNEYVRKMYYINPTSGIKTYYGSMIDGEAIYNPSGWTNDRYCRLKLIAYYDYVSNGQGRAMVQSYVYGKKRNLVGDWVYYETILSQKDISFTVIYEHFEGGADHTGSGEIVDYQGTYEEDFHQEFCQIYTPVYMQEDDTPFTTFTYGYGKGSHRGMNNLWATVSKPL